MVYINPVITKRMFPINDYAIILKIVQFCSFLQMKLIYIYLLRIVLRMVYSVCFWHHTVQIGKLVSLYNHGNVSESFCYHMLICYQYMFSIFRMKDINLIIFWLIEESTKNWKKATSIQKIKTAFVTEIFSLFKAVFWLTRAVLMRLATSSPRCEKPRLIFVMCGSILPISTWSSVNMWPPYKWYSCFILLSVLPRWLSF